MPSFLSDIQPRDDYVLAEDLEGQVGRSPAGVILDQERERRGSECSRNRRGRFIYVFPFMALYG